jgi:hypothetical protein
MSAFGWILILIGAVLGLALPKTDRRFKTGFKNNQVPNDRHVLAMLGFLGVGALCVWFSW